MTNVSYDVPMRKLAPMTHSDAVQFAYDLIDRFSHDRQFVFDLESCQYEQVRVVLEVAGYSVHRDPRRDDFIIAVRSEPDRAPVGHSAA